MNQVIYIDESPCKTLSATYIRILLFPATRLILQGSSVGRRDPISNPVDIYRGLLGDHVFSNN